MTKDSQESMEQGIDLLVDMMGGPFIDDGAALLLIAGGAALNAKTPEGITPLMCAAANGKNDIIRAMLATGRDVGLEARDDHDWTALITAAHRGDAKTVKLLLDAGADVTATDLMGRTALDYARGDAEKEKLILNSMGIAAIDGPATKRPFRFGI